VLLPLFQLAHAVAQPAPAADGVSASAQPQYRTAVELGFKEFELGNYVEAHVRFLEAAAIDRNARVLRALGMVTYELRSYPEAIAYLAEALQSNNRPLATSVRAETEELINRARGYVARYTFVLKPVHAELRLNDARLALDPSHSALLSLGTHSLEARAAAYRPNRLELRVEGGRDSTVHIDLEPIGAPPRDRASASSSLWSSPWLWIGAGVAIIGAGAVLAYALQPSPRAMIAEPVTTSQSPPGVVIRALSRQ
jgi:tetratricopeptide (TPR) repeat protein